MDRISELEARTAADTTELKRLKAERDYERYRMPLEVLFTDPGRSSDMPLHGSDRLRIGTYLAARNHDPDVVALVEYVRDSRINMTWRDEEKADELLAPFAAIKDE